MYSTVDAACDYYLNVLANVNKFAATPPKLIVLNSNNCIATKKYWLKVTERLNNKGDSVYAVIYALTTSPDDTLGEITFEEFSSLAEEIDMAVSEYRRKNFKRISRQQRHISDDEFKEMQQSARTRRNYGN